jgi:hypothetical protein
MGVSSAAHGKGRKGGVPVAVTRGREKGASRGTGSGVAEADGAPCGNRGGVWREWAIVVPRAVHWPRWASLGKMENGLDPRSIVSF